MHRFTHAYKVWKSAPQEIQDATTPEDFAGKYELRFLQTTGEMAHFIQHLKQHLWYKYNLFPNSVKLENFCACMKYNRFRF